VRMSDTTAKLLTSTALTLLPGNIGMGSLAKPTPLLL